MDRPEARQLMERCVRDRTDASILMSSCKVKIEAAEYIITGLLKIYPDLENEVMFDLDFAVSDRENTEGPGTAAAVLQILQLDEGKSFTVREMVSALERRGWLPGSESPANAVRTTLERLRTQDKGVWKWLTQPVTYSYVEPDSPQVGKGVGFDEEPF